MGKDTNQKSTKISATAGRIVGMAAVLLFLLALAVPFVDLNFLFSMSFTMFGAFDTAGIFVSDVAGWEIVYIIVYFVFVVLFGLFTLISSGRSVFSVCGCIGSWLLFFAWVVIVAVLNSNTYSGMLTFASGFYVWIAAGILEIVSIILKGRRKH